MIQTNNIAVLLATYNGATYIREQIHSLIAQTYALWQLYIHDDGSTDDTLAILHELEQTDSRIHILTYPATGGACSNFMSLLNMVDAPYYMFCDQDDVWLPNKIEIELQHIQRLEQLNSATPIIVHTDLKVVDSNLHPIHPSFWQYEHIVLDCFKTWEDYARGNTTTGCTMLFNHLTKNATLPLSPYTLMHDAWITLCVVAKGGIIDAIPQGTILYRQHGTNTLGAQNADRFTVGYRIKHFRTMVMANIAHFRQLNAIKHISVIQYILHKR